jgi:hypothetical protein
MEAPNDIRASPLVAGLKVDPCRPTSIHPRQHLLESREEPRPPGLGAMVGRFLIRL